MASFFISDLRERTIHNRDRLRFLEHVGYVFLVQGYCKCRPTGEFRSLKSTHNGAKAKYIVANRSAFNLHLLEFPFI